MSSRFQLLLFLVMVLIACSSGEKKPAPEKNYYFSIQTPAGDPEAEKIRNYLQVNIPKRKYTITFQSGIRWPYVQSFQLDQKVYSDSLMPPHEFVHRMILKSDNNEIQVGDYYLQIEILHRPDTLLYFNVSIFSMEETGLKMTATSGVHTMDTPLKNPDERFRFIQQSVLRYSFK